MIDQNLSAEEFYSRLPELPEAGRWCELVRGGVVQLDPPSAEHGAVVLNVARALGEFCTRTHRGYACFNTLLVTRRGPDTVRRPSITFFTWARRFSEMDAALSERAPRLVVEVVSTDARRRQIPDKVREYHALGTKLVWLLDLEQASVEVHRPHREVQLLPRDAALRGEGVVRGFRCEVATLLRVPDW